MTEDSHSILVVTKNSDFSSKVQALLMPPLFEVSLTDNYNEARYRCSERVYNIIIIDYADSEGQDLAMDLSTSGSTILLFTPAGLFDQVSYRVESSGILTAIAPFDTFYFYNIIKIAIAVQYKVQILSSQTVKLKERMEEIRIVNRAKMLLMQNLAMSEEQAHHYIEKEAMDRCEKKIEIAKKIIKNYET